MTIFCLSRMARAMRPAAFCRPGMAMGSWRHLRLGRRKSWQACGSAMPRLSRIWATSGAVLSRPASSCAAGLAGARFQRLQRCSSWGTRRAGGEVIERRGAVVKERRENAVGAGAREIIRGAEEGGRALMRVSDSRPGTPAEALPLAMASHATSKLADDDDL